MNSIRKNVTNIRTISTTCIDGKNIEERSSNLLKTVLNETDKVTADNMVMVNEIIVSYCKYKLEQKRANMDLDNTKLKDECLHVISYVTGV